MHNDIQEVLFSEEQIKARVAELGRAVSDEYRDIAPEGILLVSVLRGAAIFMADLAREIDIPCEMDYMAVSSYGSGTRSSGVVQIIKDVSTDIKGRHVVIAEDIIDSGLTLSFLLKMFESRGPASLSVVSLFHKQVENQAHIECCKHVGFECPDEFIVGYGLDYAELYRNLKYVGILKPEVYEN